MAKWSDSAKHLKAMERNISEKRQEDKKLAGPLSLGDAIVLLKPGLPATVKPRWIARWEVIRSKHPVYWIRHLPPGEETVFNRERLRWVPQGVDWDMLPETETRVDKGPVDNTPTQLTLKLYTPHPPPTRRYRRKLSSPVHPPPTNTHHTWRTPANDIIARNAAKRGCIVCLCYAYF